MKEKVLYVSFLIALVSMLGRSVVLGASVGDAIAIVSLCALNGFSLFLINKKKPQTTNDVWDEIAELKNAISSLKLSNSIRR